MSGNGTDMGHVVAMLHQLIVGQEQIGNRLTILESRMDRLERAVSQLQIEVQELRIGLNEVRTDVRNLREEVATLRSDVNNYHNSVFGHGIHISELDEPLTLVEQSIDPPAEPKHS